MNTFRRQLLFFPLCFDNRGPTDLVQHFAYRGTSNRRKSAARHFWLYRSPIPVGRGGGRGAVFYLFQLFLPADASHRGEGGDKHPEICRYLCESKGTVYSVPFQYLRTNETCPKNLIDSLINPSSRQRSNTENSKQIFPEKELCGHSPNFHIHVSVSDLYIFPDRSAYSAEGKYVDRTC